jgi:hypothetical protein
MLTRQEKVYIRDLLGVPMAGVPRGGHTSGYRFFSLVGNLEFYMNNLSVEEESVIAGRPVALVSFNNIPITLGQVLTIRVNGFDCVYAVQQSDLDNRFPQQAVLINMVNIINQANLGPWAGTGDSPSALAGASPLTAPEYGQIAISYTKPFNVEVSQDPTVPGLVLSVQQNGDTMPEPSMVVAGKVCPDTGGPLFTHGYINICLGLRNDILNSRRNLTLSSAGAKGDQGGVTFNPRQLQQLTALLNYWTDKLGGALYATGSPMGQPSGRITL